MSDPSIPVINTDTTMAGSDVESSGYRTPSQAVSSPSSVRETPVSFVTQQQYKRRSPYEEPSPSAVSQKTVSNTLTSRPSFLNQGRALNSTPKQHINNTSITSGNNVKGTPYKIASNNNDKKRLVEQFYNTFNESLVVPSNDNDFSSFLKHSNFSSVSASPTLENTLDFDRGFQKDVEFTNLLNHGGLAFKPFDQHLVNDENLMNYLLNIDTLTDDVKKSEDIVDHDSLQPLSDIVQRVLQTFLVPVRHSMTKLDDHNVEAIQSLEDLDNLSKYIRNLNDTTNVLLDELKKGKKTLKEKYKTEISQNIDRLNDFITSLEHLEHKLEIIKSNMTVNKQFMSSALNEKIAVLEFVNQRFIAHSKQMRYRRLKQLNVGLATIVALVGIYYYYVRLGQ